MFRNIIRAGEPPRHGPGEWLQPNGARDTVLNRIHPKKLLNSKWTAVAPTNREKHFLVTKVDFGEDQEVCSCILEAVYSGRERAIDWRHLKDASKWKQGWN